MLDDLDFYTGVLGGFGETVTLNGTPREGIFDVSSELLLDEVLTTVPSFLATAQVLASAAAGQTLTRGAASYKVRQVILQPPDGAMLRLILAKA